MKRKTKSQRSPQKTKPRLGSGEKVASNGIGDGPGARGSDWFFASNDGGEDKGLNDAGVVTFKGNIYRYLAREIIQNSLDARESSRKPVIVTFDAIELSRKIIPGMNRLKDVCERCKAFWPRDPERAFFDRAIQLTSEPVIKALRISDFNTVGVVGDDDDRLVDRSWYSLIRCSGSSSKEGGEGGSYGIGKNAPFAASSLRTVFYSTCTGKGNVAFQGVARLVTHEKATGLKAQNIGFLGDSKGISVREPEQIPKHFRRKERGTDVVILGFIAGKAWEDQLRLSVLENFWPAIHFGDLEVRIGNLEITKESLASLLEESQKDEFSAHYYYEAFTSTAAIRNSATLPNLKQVELYLHTGEAEQPKKVAMVRKSGMVIYHKMFRSAVPYCGVFLCRNKDGNGLLRAMEPPRHDTWDPDFPDRGANKYVEKEFIDYIKQCLRDLSIKDDSTVIPVPELSRFLPDDEESPEEPFGGPEQADQNRVEGFPSKPASPADRKQLPVSKMTRPKTIAPGDAVGNDGDSDGATDGDLGDGDNNGTGGPRGSDSSKTIVPIRFRAFSKNPEGSDYCATIRSDSDETKTTILTVQVVGDDSRDFARLRGARLHGGKKIPHRPGGKIGPVSLDPRKPLRIDFELEDSGKVAIEVIAYEA